MNPRKTGLVAVIVALGIGTAACGQDSTPVAAETSYITTTDTTTVTREMTTTVTETPEEDIIVDEVVLHEEPAPAAPVPVAPAAVEPVQPAPAATYYANCSAARAAGAAPVYVGQPGYGTHLDRDDDGIGCE